MKMYRKGVATKEANKEGLVGRRKVQAGDELEAK